MSAPNMSAYDFTAQTLDGQPAPLAGHRGEVMLIVNTASKCGFTPQYTGLEALWRKYKDRGLVVLGFPCNQFGAQEPGNADEIVCARTPEPFSAVGQWYYDFSQTTDEEVRQLLEEHAKRVSTHVGSGFSRIRGDQS